MPPGSTSKRLRAFVIVRVNRDPSDTHAVEVVDDSGHAPREAVSMSTVARALEEALDDANADEGAVLEWARVEARDGNQAMRTRPARWSPVPTLEHGRCKPRDNPDPPFGRHGWRRFARRGGDQGATDLEDYFATGLQDASNVCDTDHFPELDQPGPITLTADQIVDRLVMAPDFKEQWLEQNRDDIEGLDPDQAYEAWREGWSVVARRIVKHELEERARREREERELDEEDERRRRGNPGGRVPKPPHPTKYTEYTVPAPDSRRFRLMPAQPVEQSYLDARANRPVEWQLARKTDYYWIVTGPRGIWIATLELGTSPDTGADEYTFWGVRDPHGGERRTVTTGFGQPTSGANWQDVVREGDDYLRANRRPW